MDTNCPPFTADLFLFCYERDYMMSVSSDTEVDVIETFNSTSRYLDQCRTQGGGGAKGAHAPPK